MIVKDNYVCSSCQEQKSCFVFEEFIMPLALCMECYVMMKVQKETIRPLPRTCMLCDTSKEEVLSFVTKNPLLLKGHLHACADCFEKFSKLVEEHRYL